MFCLRMKSVLLTNQKQPLKFVQQNSYLDFLPNTLHIIIQRVHLLVKLQAGRTNKQTANMKSLTGISQGFDKCTKATLQNNYLQNASRWQLLLWNMITISLWWKTPESLELYWYQEVIEIKFLLILFMEEDFQVLLCSESFKCFFFLTFRPVEMKKFWGAGSL